MYCQIRLHIMVSYHYYFRLCSHHYQVDRVVTQLQSAFGIDKKDVVCVSAKAGINIDQVFSAIIHKMDPPTAAREEKFSALLFDSWHNEFRGVILLLEVSASIEGRIV